MRAGFKSDEKSHREILVDLATQFSQETLIESGLWVRGSDGLAVERGDDADHVIVYARQFELRGAHAVELGRGRRDDGELRRVDAIRFRRDNSELTAFLAAIGQEFPRVLEIVAINNFSENALGRNRVAIRRQHQGNFAL